MLWFILVWAALMWLIIGPSNTMALVKGPVKKMLPSKPQKNATGFTEHGYRKGYDAHYTRQLEIKELGQAYTTCGDEVCGVCYPKELTLVGKPTTRDVKSTGQISTTRSSATVESVTTGTYEEAFRPPDVPVGAKFRIMYDPHWLCMVIDWTWQERGQTHVRRVKVTRETESIEIINGTGNVVKTYYLPNQRSITS